MSNKRITEKLVNNNWIVIPFMDLKNGDTFRLFEPDMEPVENKGKKEFLATSDPYTQNDVGTIDCINK